MNDRTEVGEIHRALRWGPQDEVLLRETAPRIAHRVTAWVDAFYERLQADPTAVAILGDAGRIMRLRRSLSAWFHEMLTLPVDEAYARAREEIGRTHVRIGMPQHLMVTAMHGLRTDVRRDAVHAWPEDPAKGEEAAEALAKALDGKGKVIVLRYQEGSASTELRELGFLEALRRLAPGIQVVSDTEHGGATVDSAMSTAESLVGKHKGGFDGVFCPNETTTMGMLRALQTMGLASKVKFVGFDSSQKLVAALASGEIHALVLQNPFRMGELGVTTLVKHARNEAIPKVQDTGVTLVTKANMEEPEVRALLVPDLSELSRR